MSVRGILSAMVAGVGISVSVGAMTAMGSTAAPIAPFSAHYTADWKTINVGTSDLTLEPGAGAGAYVYTWTITARGIFRLMYSSDLVQKSWMRVVDDHIRPEQYRAEQGASSAIIEFDWQARRVRGAVENKPLDILLPAQAQDLMSIQVEVMLDLKNGDLPPRFSILDKDAIKEFDYSLEGPARLRTALGMLDTLVVASQRPGNDRLLRMWFAPSLGYLPVQAERTRGGKLEFAIRIKSLNARPAHVLGNVTPR